MNPSCPDMVLLLGFALGEVSDEERRSVEHHVRDCPECREQVEVFQKTREGAAVELLSPPHWVTESVLNIPEEYPRRRVRAELVHSSGGGRELAGVRHRSAFAGEVRDVWSGLALEVEVQLQENDDRGVVVLGSVRGTDSPSVTRVRLIRGEDEDPDHPELETHVDDLGQFLLELSSTENRFLLIEANEDRWLEIPLV